MLFTGHSQPSHRLFVLRLHNNAADVDVEKDDFTTDIIDSLVREGEFHSRRTTQFRLVKKGALLKLLRDASRLHVPTHQP